MEKIVTGYKGFPKIPRLNREVVVTEKIDGTSGQIFIEQGGAFPVAGEELDETIIAKRFDGALWQYMRAGSRSRWLTRSTDNFGFAKWVQEHADELWSLGVGQHFGEWWGSGIQRGYGLTKGEKRFSLFNTGRWVDQHAVVGSKADIQLITTDKSELAPACCHVVPVLWRGPFASDRINDQITLLHATGSAAAPGFDKPEGIVIYHTAAKQYFKVTLENDKKPKTLT